MIILSVDTSSQIGSVAVSQNHQILSQRSYTGRLPLSQKTLELVHQCLEDSKIPLKKVDSFAVANGPGSFTGLRLGASMTIGLSIATGKPIVGIGTLPALAFTASETDMLICPLLDARKSEIYGATFRRTNGELIRITEDTVQSPDSFFKQITEETFFLGSGAEKHKEKIKTLGINKTTFGTMQPNISIAAAVGQLAYNRINKEEKGGGMAIKPNYIRRCEAELSKEMKNH